MYEDTKALEAIQCGSHKLALVVIVSSVRTNTKDEVASAVHCLSNTATHFNKD